jgi:hypothetical protein
MLATMLSAVMPANTGIQSGTHDHLGCVDEFDQAKAGGEADD